MARIDARNTITSLAMLEVGVELDRTAPGGTLEILCDDASVMEDIRRIHPDCECGRDGRYAGTGCLFVLRKKK